MKPTTLLLVLGLAFSAAACSGDEEAALKATPTPGVEAGASPAGATATALPRVDGTVPGEGFGGTDPVAIKADPDPAPGIAVLEDIRTGAHPEQGGWDRIVFEFRDIRPEGIVEYVTGDSECGSGAAVSLPGTTILKVTFHAAQAHDDNGQPTVGPPFVVNRMVLGPGNAILRGQVTCDFEAEVGVALGIDSRERFNVRFLENPTRVVIDVKW